MAVVLGDVLFPIGKENTRRRRHLNCIHSIINIYIFCWIVWSMAGDKDTCDFKLYTALIAETNVAIFLHFYRSFHFCSFLHEITKWKCMIDLIDVIRWRSVRVCVPSNCREPHSMRGKTRTSNTKNQDNRKMRSQLVCDANVNMLSTSWRWLNIRAFFFYLLKKIQQLCVSWQFDYMRSITTMNWNHLRVPFDVPTTDGTNETVFFLFILKINFGTKVEFFGYSSIDRSIREYKSRK